MKDIGSGVAENTISAPLRKELDTTSEKCINCKLCQKECGFLRKYGKPKEIADSYNPTDKIHQVMPFECSLCELCASVCPVKINPAVMFLEMRRESVARDAGDFPEHARMAGYEKRGTSKRYTLYIIPKECDTIFFPGCALSGTRPDTVSALYEHMKRTVPSMGIVLDCCTQPSHDLGRQEYFSAMFGEMADYLRKNGIRTILVACPSCYKVFQKYGNELSVSTVYAFLLQHGLPETASVNESISIHDPCALRFEESVHTIVRDLAAKKGVKIVEMPHVKTKTLCCGEGGAAGFLASDLANNWRTIRKNEVEGRRLIAYCAGCTNSLNPHTPTHHILDLLFKPEATMNGTVKTSKAPFTYWNRLRLKKQLQKTATGSITRERTFMVGDEENKGGMYKRTAIFVLIIAVIATVRFSGATQYLEQEKLRELIQGYGTMAPLLYMLVYALAPSLFLPGLPITIAGGILFGPFWGVVYTIISSTLGACLAFLISRYVARDWIEKKLKSPRWRRLDQEVETHGWKIVAFTRLIPLFPFNLLNYAFGLTKIPFLHYAVATFACMLPACIAFIVFSSSILDLIKGKISPMFIVGLGLVVLVSFIPILYRRNRIKKGLSDSL